MKRIFRIVIILTSLMLVSCSKKENTKDINIGAMKGPTGMGMVQLMDENNKGNTKHKYNFNIVGTPDEISSGLIKGDFDIAAVPCNLASVLYNKTNGDIRLIGINTLGVLYIVETGNEINEISDLKGKTIYSTGLGATPQYTLNYLLKSNGIDPEKDVIIEYKSEATEVAAILSENENAIAMLPQPFVTTVLMNNENARIALDIDLEWKKVGKEDTAVVTGVVVAKKEFLEKNKKAVKEFMDEYKISTDFVNTNIEDAAVMMEKMDLFKAPVAKKAIPSSNIVLIQGEEMKNLVTGYLEVLENENPISIGGKLPGDDFYYLP